MQIQDKEVYENGHVRLEVLTMSDGSPRFWIACRVGAIEFDLKDFASLLEILFSYYPDTIEADPKHHVLANGLAFHELSNLHGFTTDAAGCRYAKCSIDDEEMYLNAAKLAAEYIDLYREYTGDDNIE